MNRRKLLVGAAATALAPFALASSGKARSHQDGVEWFTNVEVKTHDGRTLRFYDDVMKGKILLINFFFTECDAICPLMTENLVRVQDLLVPRVGKDIFMVSITLRRSTTRRRYWPPMPGPTASGQAGCSSPASRTTSNFSATAWDLSIPIPSRTPTRSSISAPSASPTSRCTAGPWARRWLDPAALVRTVKRVIPEPA